VIRPLKITLVLAAAGVLALGLAVSPAAAKKAAKKPACWKVLLNDWYDGTVDGTYALRCYRDLLQRLKDDAYASSYTSAVDDIRRAYQQRRAEILAGRRAEPYRSAGSGDSDVVPPSGPPSGGSSGTGAVPFNPVSPDRWYPSPAQPVQRTDGGGPVKDLITAGSDDATSIPIPLIILAGIAALLMAAGAASLIAKRAQRRRVTVPVQPAPPPARSR
jgi:hypothetical protein